MQVKVIMPPKVGIMRKTPTGRAVGRNVIWHNFLCCSGICYALGQIYLNWSVTENRRCAIAHSSYGTSPIMCFCLGITRTFHPPRII